MKRREGGCGKNGKILKTKERDIIKQVPGMLLEVVRQGEGVLRSDLREDDATSFTSTLLSKSTPNTHTYLHRDTH